VLFATGYRQRDLERQQRGTLCEQEVIREGEKEAETGQNGGSIRAD